MVNATLISYVVVIFFSLILGIIASFFFGYFLIPSFQKRRLAKRSIKRIKEQEEQGYKHFTNGAGKEIILSEIIKRKVNEDENKK